MPYAKLLNNLIESSKLSVKEIVARCKEHGVNITASYISMLRNPDNNKIPSDEVSRALAKACEAEYEESLVIEGYIDKAPKEFKEFLDEYREILIQSLLILFSNQITKSDMKMLAERMKELPISDLILQSKTLTSGVDFEKAADSINVNMSITDDMSKTFIELKEPEGFIIEDDSMFPIIRSGSKVNPLALPLNDYKDGDILLVVVKGSKKPICRKCMFPDSSREKITLMAYNQKIQTETYRIDEVKILGKVKRIITDIFT
ncbi:MAG: S24 family peptidase [Candidatus Cloacimonetes bacterium]|nr:S24 family peptidase [Candidatus Cloacimonadota bacterium]